MPRIRFGIRTLLFAMLLAGLSIGSYCYIEYHRRWQQIQTTLANFDTIETFPELHLFYDELFVEARKFELKKLMTTKNDSVATQSAWEIVNQTIPKESSKGPAYRPKQSELKRFVAFFEQRNRIEVPENWKESLLGSRANRRDNIYPGDPKQHPYHRSETDWVFCPVVDKVTKEKDGKLIYQADDYSISIPENMIEHYSDGTFFGNVNCIKFGNLLFLTTHCDNGYPHKLICISLLSQEEIWQKDVCGSWWWGSEGFASKAWVELKATEDFRIFVFGISSIGIYAHGFDLKTGKTIVHFANNL